MLLTLPMVKLMTMSSSRRSAREDPTSVCWHVCSHRPAFASRVLQFEEAITKALAGKDASVCDGLSP